MSVCSREVPPWHFLQVALLFIRAFAAENTSRGMVTESEKLLCTKYKAGDAHRSGLVLSVILTLVTVGYFMDIICFFMNKSWWSHTAIFLYY
jgi:hypothetical protein